MRIITWPRRRELRTARCAVQAADCGNVMRDDIERITERCLTCGPCAGVAVFMDAKGNVRVYPACTLLTQRERRSRPTELVGLFSSEERRAYLAGELRRHAQLPLPVASR